MTTVLAVEAKVNDVDGLVVDENVHIHDRATKLHQMICKQVEVDFGETSEHGVLNQSEVFRDLLDLETSHFKHFESSLHLVTDLNNDFFDGVVALVLGNLVKGGLLMPQVGPVEGQRDNDSVALSATGGRLLVIDGAAARSLLRLLLSMLVVIIATVMVVVIVMVRVIIVMVIVRIVMIIAAVLLPAVLLLVLVVFVVFLRLAHLLAHVD